MHFRRQRDILPTLRERKSRLTLARRLQSKDAELTADAIVAELGGLPARARRTITRDNGGEIVEMNPPREFFDNPRHERSKLFPSQILAH